MSLPLTTLFSAGVFSSTAQALAIQLWAAVPPMIAILLAGGAVNARYLVMGASLHRLFPDVPGRLMLPTLFILGDGSWLVTMGEADDGRRDAGVLFGASAVTIVGWVGGTVLGYLTSLSLTGAWAAAAAFVPLGFIVAYVPDRWHGLRTAPGWLAAGAGALLVSLVLASHWAILIGGVVGTAVAMCTEGPQDA